MINSQWETSGKTKSWSGFDLICPEQPPVETPRELTLDGRKRAMEETVSKMKQTGGPVSVPTASTETSQQDQLSRRRLLLAGTSLATLSALGAATSDQRAEAQQQPEIGRASCREGV